MRLNNRRKRSRTLNMQTPSQTDRNSCSFISSSVGVEHDSEGRANSRGRKISGESCNSDTLVSVSSADSSPDGLSFFNNKNYQLLKKLNCEMSIILRKKRSIWLHKNPLNFGNDHGLKKLLSKQYLVSGPLAFILCVFPKRL